MLRSAAVLVIETLVVGWAAAAHAVAAVAGRFVPHLWERLKREIAERAVVRRFAPSADFAELLELLIVVKQARAARQG